MRRNRPLPIWMLVAMFVGRLLVQRWWEARGEREVQFAQSDRHAMRHARLFWGPFEVL